jgi:hypothetical protein
MTTFPKLPKGYRWLRVGTRVREGDKFYCDFCYHWHKSNYPGRHVGYPHLYIRKVTP